jgi:predicted MFS family arabinose efflux permease
MPFALGVGRRVIILMSTLILVAGAVLCATAKSYEVHLAARCIVGLAAGQSEALVPMITQVRAYDCRFSDHALTFAGNVLPP